MDQPYVQYQNVTVRHGRDVVAIADLTLNIAKGEFVFFVGRTGAGKSTLLKLLTREFIETNGKVILNSVDVASYPNRDLHKLRRTMGVVPQDFALLPRKTVWENVAYGMRAVGATRKEVRKLVPEILERVNIGHRADAFPYQLSGGEQQRVAIGRALINDPPLLLADEPTGNLDPGHSWEIMEILRGLNQRGTTVLVASHDIMVVSRMNERVVTLDHGKLTQDQTVPTVEEESPDV